MDKPNEMEDYEFRRRFRAILSVIAFIPILLVSLNYLIRSMNDIEEKTKIIQTEGKVLDCTIGENNTLFSFIGLGDNLEYKTVIVVDDEVLESNNKDIYYLCKDKVDSNITFKIETFDGKADSIKKVINN